MDEQTTESATLFAQGASPINASGLFDVVIGLAMIVMLIFILAFLFRKFGNGSAGMGGLIKVIAAMSLGGRDRIALISVGQKNMLLGISPGRIATLHVFEEGLDEMTLDPASAEFKSPRSEFAEKLQNLLVGQKS
ncbi:MAG: flagellar biosynthetic protein FliO [Pseudohongiellaceae bacterium]